MINLDSMSREQMVEFARSCSERAWIRRPTSLKAIMDARATGFAAAAAANEISDSRCRECAQAAAMYAQEAAGENDEDERLAQLEWIESRSGEHRCS